MERVWVRTEPTDIESTANLYIKCEVGNSFAVPSLTTSMVSSTSEKESAVIIKSEITFGDYECIPSTDVVQFTNDGKSIAEASVVRISGIEMHQRTHNSENVYSCIECGKEFSSKASLIRHLRIHSDEMRFPCDECGVKFAQKSYLKSHRLTHSGIKKFVCGECEKKFGHNSHLKAHQLTHQKSFACEMRFTTKFYLKSHKLKHIGLKPFACSDCDKKFYTRSHLNQHRRVHTRKTEPETDSNWKIVFDNGENVPPPSTNNENVESFLETSDNEFNCDKIGSKFDVKSSHETHQAANIGKLFVCDETRIKFDNKEPEVHQSQTADGPDSSNEFGTQFVEKIRP